MKVSVSIFLITVGSTVARRIRNPFEAAKRAKQLQFLMNVKDGKFLDSADSLDPKIDWGTSTKVGDVDIDYGVRASVSTKDGAERTGWGKALYDTKNGWKLSAKGEMDINDRTSAEIELDVLNEELDVSIAVDASVTKDGGVDVKNIELEKIASTNLMDRPGTLEIRPRYDVSEAKSEIEVAYESEDTSLSFVATEDERSLKLSRKLGNIMPYFKNAKYSLIASDKEDLTFEYERTFDDDDGSLKASFRQNGHASVQWKDNGWIAEATSKMDGLTPLEPDVRIKKDLSF